MPPSTPVTTTMTLFYLTIPFMVLGVAVAVLPVLIGSFRHHKSLSEGRFETQESMAQEADFWHHMLGHRTVEDYAPTPDLVEDKEVLRVVPAERMVNSDPTVWAVQQKHQTNEERVRALYGIGDPVGAR